MKAPPLCFYFGKIKTDVYNVYRHFVVLHLRPSSRGLHDATWNIQVTK